MIDNLDGCNSTEDDDLPRSILTTYGSFHHEIAIPVIKQLGGPNGYTTVWRKQGKKR
jgi:hypothetical protein